MKFIHITDFHLVAPGERLWGLDPVKRLRSCLSDIAQWHADADFCAITGDLTNNGAPEAYAWLAEQLASFPMATYVIPGNHDDRNALLDAFPHTARDLNGFVQHAHARDEGVFLFLDTLKGPVSEGAYCAERRAWLKDQLAAAKDRPVWLCMHHPPFDIGVPYMDRIKLEEHEAFAEVISGHSDIRHIFFGHVHRAAYVNWRGIPCTCLPGTSHQVPLKREAVGGAPYSVEPAMYAIVTIDQDQTVIHFDACLDRSPARMG